MEIRKITPEDGLEVGRLYVKSWQESYKGLLPQDFLDALQPSLWQYCFLGYSGSFVLTLSGKIIGHCCVRQSEYEDDFGEVHTIYILPEYWGQGYGGKLFEHGIAYLKETGYEKIALWVLNGNARAKQFYSRHGFTPTFRTIDVNIGGKMVTDTRYINFI